MTLRWEEQRDGLSAWAYSGELVIGMAGIRDDGTVWYDAVNAVHMKWIAKGYGEVKNMKTAKRAVETAWAKWLAKAGLAPIAGDAT